MSTDTICADCESPFEITEGEIAFYKSKGFSLPRRCKSCRDSRKMKRQAQRSDTE